MMESIKKHLPMIVGAVAIVGGIIYLRRNGAGAPSAGSSSNGSYSVISPPDNSAAVNAAAGLETTRLNLAGTALGYMTQLSEDQINADTLLKSLDRKSATDIQLAQIGSDTQGRTEANTLEGFRIQSDFNLRSTALANDAAFNIQKEQDSAAINLHSLDTQTQNNAIHAQASVQHHRDNTAAILQIAGIIGMIAMCYDQTENAAAARDVYYHSPVPQSNDGPVTRIQGPNWRHRPSIPVPPPRAPRFPVPPSYAGAPFMGRR